ncbi:MAG: GH25 family lysozyme [Megasphaera sp.]|uniref:GH25 family lysozyme n=1 Tax=Megasphaera sp. TaxID=2023260 RepID=UPI003EFD4EA9
MKVVDISDWQEGINFDDLVAAGVKGAIIKALNGTNPTDCVYDFIAECRQRGLPWGVYCYTHAWTPDDARREAQAMLNLLGGETPPLGIWYDIEDDPKSLPSPVDWLTGVDDPTGRCSAFISELNAAGQAAGIYAGYYALRDYIATNELADYVPIWYNQYNPTCDYGEVCSLPLAAWQYTSTDRIDGWNYDLDMNEWYK